MGAWARFRQTLRGLYRHGGRRPAVNTLRISGSTLDRSYDIKGRLEADLVEKNERKTGDPAGGRGPQQFFPGLELDSKAIVFASDCG